MQTNEGRGMFMKTSIKIIASLGIALLAAIIAIFLIVAIGITSIAALLLLPVILGCAVYIGLAVFFKLLKLKIALSIWAALLGICIFGILLMIIF